MKDLAKLIDEILDGDEYDMIRITRNMVSLRRVGTSGYVVDQLGEEDVSPSHRLFDTFEMCLKQGRWSWMKTVGVNFVEEQCRDWIMAGLLYEHHSTIMMSDELFDSLTLDLMSKYDTLPSWFKDRVTVEDLKAGSASGITYTDEEREEARRWKRKNEKPAESKRRVNRDDDDFI